MTIRVAVLDHDAIVRDEVLVRGLVERGFEAEAFAQAGDLYQRMLAVSFEHLVLDIDVEGGGLQVASYLRGLSPIGIVTLAARASREERVRGLMEAVDVWLAKPVDLDVLAATLHSLSRRVRSQADFAHSAANVTAGWSLSPGNWRLVAPDRRSMPLNLLERHLLIRLLANAGELVAHDDLIDALGAAGGALDRHRLEIVVHRLRRKVRQHFGHALPLRSIRGSGYVFSPEERDAEPQAST